MALNTFTQSKPQFFFFFLQRWEFFKAKFALVFLLLKQSRMNHQFSLCLFVNINFVYAKRIVRLGEDH